MTQGTPKGPPVERGDARGSGGLRRAPSFWEAFRYWVRLGFISFGGPAGQIAIMHRDLVQRRQWISEERFLHALNFCMLLPGPEAQQLATYVGWRLHGTRGGLAAGLLFVLPGSLVVLALSALYAVFHGLRGVDALFFGLKPAVLAVVIEALL
ncbi:MAG: chromate transporter, partial [Thermoanaerobaculia bacterium]